MGETIQPTEAWAVLGRTFDNEPYSLEKATLYPITTSQEWLERTFPGRVIRVTIAPARAKTGAGE